MNQEVSKIKELVDGAQHIVVVQADNPDGDSLASSLALEEILSDMHKQVSLYCGVDIPDYLKHLRGWDRVSKELPTKFDTSIIVDTSAIILLEKLEHSQQRNWIATKPVIVLDHHNGVACDIPYATVVINDGLAVATGEVIYELARELNWPLSLQAKTHLTSSILADSLGLSADGTTPQTYRIVADLVESGVDRASLEAARRAFSKMPVTILRYKGRLIERAELLAEGRVAIVDIPHEELMEFSPLYNPAPLIQPDLLQTEDVGIALVIKHYNDGKILVSIRCNSGTPIAAKLAEHFGGGGHAYAAGFKTTNRTYREVKSECIATATELLDNLNKEPGNEAV